MMVQVVFGILERNRLILPKNARKLETAFQEEWSQIPNDDEFN